MKEHNFKDFVLLLEQLEKESGRIAMREILARFLKECSDLEIEAVVYLTLGKVAPDYKEIILGVSNALCLKVLARVAGYSERTIKARFNEVGDIGELAHQVLKPRDTPPVTINWVFEQIIKLSKDTKIEYKLDVMAATLVKLQPIEAKYYFRILLEQLRVGVQEPTVLEALTLAKLGSLDDLDQVRRSYHLCGDVGYVAKVLYSKGLSAIKEFKVSCGLPIVPMLAKPLKSSEELFEKTEGQLVVEYKYDGLRVQAHICDSDHIELFSRNLGRYTEQFPDLVEYLRESVQVFPCILEGEIIAYDFETDEILPFQLLVRRRGRKYDIEEMSKEIPVALMVFDILLYQSKELIDLPFEERRAILLKALKPHPHVKIINSEKVTNVEQIEIIFQKAIQDGTEGLIGKHIKSRYVPGKRGIGWFKLKRDYQSHLADTIDCVVIGAYHGTGRRAGSYGSLLCAIKSADGVYRTVCKLGSGITDEMVDTLPQMLEPLKLNKPPKNVNVASEMEPDIWFEPKIVLEVEAAEITLSPIHTAAFGKIHPNVGLALRFPRLKRFRDDKSPEDITTEDELIELYRQQPQQKVVRSADIQALMFSGRKRTVRKKERKVADEKQKTLDSFF